MNNVMKNLNKRLEYVLVLHLNTLAYIHIISDAPSLSGDCIDGGGRIPVLSSCCPDHGADLVDCWGVHHVHCCSNLENRHLAVA